MKTLFKSLKITLVFCVFFSVFYILILWLFAQVAGPNKGNAEVATLDGKVVGAANVGQMFTKDIYFWGRPSCAGDGYDASSSSGVKTDKSDNLVTQNYVKEHVEIGIASLRMIIDEKKTVKHLKFDW